MHPCKSIDTNWVKGPLNINATACCSRLRQVGSRSLPPRNQRHRAGCWSGWMAGLALTGGSPGSHLDTGRETVIGALVVGRVQTYIVCALGALLLGLGAQTDPVISCAFNALRESSAPRLRVSVPLAAEVLPDGCLKAGLNRHQEKQHLTKLEYLLWLFGLEQLHKHQKHRLPQGAASPAVCREDRIRPLGAVFLNFLVGDWFWYSPDYNLKRLSLGCSSNERYVPYLKTA